MIAFIIAIAQIPALYIVAGYCLDKFNGNVKF